MKNNWKNEYPNIRPLYEQLSVKLKILIEELLKSNKIDYHLIEARAKEIKSLEVKLNTKQKSSKLAEITDLCGLRVIVYYPDDIERVIRFIREEFIIDESNSIIKGEEFNPNEFGYKSSHLVFMLGNNRDLLPEWKIYKDFKVEIQIRTVLQHAWASISHTLQYKSKQDIPKHFKENCFD